MGATAILFSTTTLAQQSAPIGELFAADGNARLVQPAGAGMSVVPGSELSAGIAPARLKLYRGGDVRICPRSGLSVNSGKFGLMFAMGTGTIEIDYTMVQRGSDFIITPDFSIQLNGPGKYHFALAADKQGDTCVKSLPGNSGAVQVSELSSSSVYRVRSQDSISFHGGKISGNSPLKPEEVCGCPSSVPLTQASAEAPAPQPTPQPAPQTQAPQQAPSPAPAVPVAKKDDVTAPLPADQPGQVHVEVDAPFVFSAKTAGAIKPYSVARLSLSTLPNLYFVQEIVDPVVLEQKPAVVSVRQEAPARREAAADAQGKPAEKKEKKGFLGKLKGLFGGIFHH